MPDLRELYQEVILDHSKKPRNYREMTNARRRADGYNPLCGDKFTVYVDLEDGVVKDITFQGSGCAISKASASMMTEKLKGKTFAEAEALFSTFHDLVTGKPGGGQGSAAPGAAGKCSPGQGSADLGKLKVFAGVCEFPVRVKCATLAWHTMRAALEQKAETVSTE